MEVDILPDTDNMSDDSESLPTLNVNVFITLKSENVTDDVLYPSILKEYH